MKKFFSLFLMLFILTAFSVSTFGADVSDGIKMHSTWSICKFKDPSGDIDKALQAGAPVDRFKDAMISPCEKIDGNLGLNEGLQNLINLAITSGTQWANGNAYCGVGDSATAEVATQTGLQASTNKTYKAMNTSYPARTTQMVEFRCDYGSSDANYAWEEYTVSTSNSDSGINLNRKTSSKGTKASGETWTLSLQVTFQ